MSEQQAAGFSRLYGKLIRSPEDICELLLRSGQLQPGRSAFETADAWIKADQRGGDGLPVSVKKIFAAAPEWADAWLVNGFFEHATPLDTRLAPSMTDLLAICALRGGLGVISVEGKAGETFDRLVGDWKGSAGERSGKAARFEWTCRLLGIEPDDCDHLRWQLFHRTAAAVLEAKRFHARHAIMLVHDFRDDPQRDHFDDYCAFASRLGLADAARNAVTSQRDLGGVSLRLAWISEKPSTSYYPSDASRSTT